MVPAGVEGLALWLDAGRGVFGSWAGCASNGSATAAFAENGYPNNGNTHRVRVYAYRTENEQTVFSPVYLEIEYAEADNGLGTFGIAWSWSAANGAEGYRLLKYDALAGWDFDHYTDTTDTSLWDEGAGQFGSGATVEPLPGTAPAGDGDYVIRWEDCSVCENDASSSSAAQRPVLKTGLVRGEPVVRFDGADDGLLTGLVLSGAFTLLAVYAASLANDNAGRAIQGTANWFLGPRNGFYQCHHGSVFTGGPVVVPGVFVFQTVWRTGGTVLNYVNGALVGRIDDGGEDPGQIGLGSCGGYNEPMAGDIAEVMVFNRALDEAERKAVELYLEQKYRGV